MLLSQSPIGLQRLIQSFSNDYWEQGLTINYVKSKVLVFTKVSSDPRYKWFLSVNELEQIMTFKYLGVILDAHLTWKPQSKAVMVSAIYAAIMHFFYRKGGQ